MSRLYTYFGVVGIASLAGWLVSLCILAAFCRSAARTGWYRLAFVLSLIAYGLALLNSSNISSIEVDRIEELAKLQAEQPTPAEEEVKKPKQPELRFAEETKQDALDLAGKKASTAAPSEPGGSSEKKPGNKHPVSSIQNPASSSSPGRHSYRDRGMQEREEGKTRKLEEIEDIKEAEETVSVRTLPEADVVRADRYDRMNLFFARWTPWLALALLLYDYLSRFNRTTGYLAPVPIACRLVDAIFPKTHVVRVPASQASRLRRHLTEVVRKGETFIYFGDADPWDAPHLHRLWISHYRIGSHRLWRLPKLTYDSPETMADSTFILDGVWFGRYCVVLTSQEAARELLDALMDYLRTRRIPRAAARRTVSIAWAFRDPLPADLLAELAFLCRETNFKLLDATAAPTDEATPPFDELVTLPVEGSA